MKKGITTLLLTLLTLLLCGCGAVSEKPIIIGQIKDVNLADETWETKSKWKNYKEGKILIYKNFAVIEETNGTRHVAELNQFGSIVIE